MAADPRVAYISEDRPVWAVADSLPTGIDRIDAEPASSPAPDASGPAVAVIDTGSGPHPDLNIVGGVNCQSGPSFNDGNGHGTHVAGTIGARNNGTGVVGVHPGVPIYSVRVLNNAGSGSWAAVICGIDWVAANAASKGIKIANMSLAAAAATAATARRPTRRCSRRSATPPPPACCSSSPAAAAGEASRRPSDEPGAEDCTYAHHRDLSREKRPIGRSGPGAVVSPVPERECAGGAAR